MNKVTSEEESSDNHYPSSEKMLERTVWTEDLKEESKRKDHNLDAIIQEEVTAGIQWCFGINCISTWWFVMASL